MGDGILFNTSSEFICFDSLAGYNSCAVWKGRGVHVLSLSVQAKLLLS